MNISLASITTGFCLRTLKVLWVLCFFLLMSCLAPTNAHHQIWLWQLQSPPLEFSESKKGQSQSVSKNLWFERPTWWHDASTKYGSIHQMMLRKKHISPNLPDHAIEIGPYINVIQNLLWNHLVISQGRFKNAKWLAYTNWLDLPNVATQAGCQLQSNKSAIIIHQVISQSQGFSLDCCCN